VGWVCAHGLQSLYSATSGGWRASAYRRNTSAVTANSGVGSMPWPAARSAWGDVALEEPEQKEPEQKEPEQDAAQLGPIPSATGTCSKNPVTSAAKASGFSCCIGLSLR
jgi:hypothetical protein